MSRFWRIVRQFFNITNSIPTDIFKRKCLKTKSIKTTYHGQPSGSKNDVIIEVFETCENDSNQPNTVRTVATDIATVLSIGGAVGGLIEYYRNKSRTDDEDIKNN